jgi:4-hydroxy-2-oxoheptanedioate aldolase
MRENAIRRLWRDGGAAINGWLAIPTSFSAETMAHQGWDSLTIDMQHGVVDYQAALAMLTAISTTETVPLVRVPWLDQGIIMKMLDAGAYGVICPMINSAEEARRLVAACRYPPAGQRSFGPIRALLYAGADYATHANDTVLSFAMIETRDGLDNLEEIAAVEGLDGFYVGPSDLSLALGCTPKLDQEEAPVVEAIDRIVRVAKENDKVAGIHNMSPEYALRMIDKGYSFVTIGSDARLMVTATQDVLGVMRGSKKTVEGVY